MKKILVFLLVIVSAIHSSAQVPVPVPPLPPGAPRPPVPPGIKPVVVAPPQPRVVRLGNKYYYKKHSYYNKHTGRRHYYYKRHRRY